MELAEKISKIIQDALSSTIGIELRSAAHLELDEITRNLDPVQLAEISLYLCGSSSKIEVVISSLQFLQVVTKFKWHLLPETSRESIKESLCVLLEQGFPILPLETRRIVHEPMIKVIVEICKREWPQLWPTLFSKLFHIAQNSDLPLLVIRRLAEDVITNGGMNSDLREERKDRLKELNVALNLLAPEIFNFLFLIISRDVDIARRATALSCLQAFFEIPNLGLIDEARMQALFELLVEPGLRCEAIEALLLLLDKARGSKKETNIPIFCLQRANIDLYEMAVRSIPSLLPSQLDSDHGIFLQRAAEVISHLISISNMTCAKARNILCLMRSLFGRGELLVVHGVLIALNVFITATERVGNEEEKKALQELLIDAIMAELDTIVQRIVSVSTSSQEKISMSLIKAELGNLLRYVGKRRFSGLYNIVHCWIATLVSTLTPIRSSPIWGEVNMKWEALAVPLDAISSIIPEGDPIGAVGLQDFGLLVRRFDDEGDLEVKSRILSCVSPLFPFVQYCPGDVKFFCRSILACYVTPPAPEGQNEPPGFRTLRRHVGALLIKLSARNPKLLLSLFDVLKDFAWRHNATLALNELHSFIETLIILSDELDEERQKKFLAEIIVPKEWETISTITESTATLLAHFSNEADLSRLRRLIILNLLIFRSALRRIGTKGLGANRVHPAHYLLLPLIPIVLQLVKAVHGILESPSHAVLFELTPSERSSLLGLAYANYAEGTVTIPPPKNFIEKAQTFLATLTEIAYTILGESCEVLSPGIYEVPQLGNAYFQYIGSNMHLLSDFKVRGILRNVFRPLTLKCPANRVDCVTQPFLQSFCPFIRERLASKWASLGETDAGEEEEILANAGLRILSKEVFDWLSRLLEMKTNTGEEGRMDMDEGEGQRSAELGVIGNILLRDEGSFTAIAVLAGTALSWNDMATNLKASRVLLYFTSGDLMSTELSYELFLQVLKTVGIWVKSDPNFDTLLRIVDSIFVKFHETDPRLSQTLLEFGLKMDEVGRLKGLAADVRNLKKRKEIFRRQVIARESYGEMKSSWLKGLPPLALMTQKEKKRELKEEINLKECFTLIHN